MNWLPRNIPVEATARVRARFPWRQEWIAVRVIHADEELMIAKTVCRVLGLG
jgi:acetate kinase